MSNASAIVANIESFYASVRPFEAELVIQPTLSKLREAEPSYRARLIFESSGMMRIAFYDGALTVINAGFQSTFSPQANEIVQEPVAIDHCPAFLVFACRLAPIFTFEEKADDAPDSGGGTTLVGTPRTASTLVAKVILSVDGAHGVRRVVFLDASGNGLRVEISALRSVRPARDTFTMSIPPGASVKTLPARSLYRSPLP